MRLLRLVLVTGLSAALLAGCAEDEPDVPEARGTWTRGADLPLSPRTSPQVGWTGNEVLVVGGDSAVVPDDTGGGPGDPVADGAAYDPKTDSWRPIADAPEPIPYYFRSAMVGDTMVVQGSDETGRVTGLLAYDAGDDSWTELPDAPRPIDDTGSLVARDTSVFVTTRRLGYVMVLDVAAATWSVLPPDTVEPALDSFIVSTDGEDVFLCGRDSTAVDDGDTPSFVLVDRWDGTTWSRYPQSEQVGCVGHWTGERLVSIDIQTATGLDGNPPFGGRLDPATGEWTSVPNAPDLETPLPESINANAAAGPLIAGWGFVYDDRDGTWTPFGRPDSPVDNQTGAAFADGRLVVVGGRDQEAGYDGYAGLSNQTWIWAAAG